MARLLGLYVRTLLACCAVLCLCGAYPVGIANQPLWATRAYYGDLSDDGTGNCNVTSGTATQAKDKYCHNLNVSVGATAFPANFRLFGDTCTINGTLDNSGQSATTSTQGNATAFGSIIGGTSGGPGITSGSGATGGIAGGAFATSNTTDFTGISGGWTALIGKGGKGGTGGQGSCGGQPLGGALNPSSVDATYGLSSTNPMAEIGALFGAGTGIGVGALVGGGSGGSSGCWDGVTGSGGGGAGGGQIILVCRVLTGSGTISANGGAGGASSGAGMGAGGGGGGGRIVLIVGDMSTWTGTLSVTGGAGGACTGGCSSTATAGANGATIIING
jgi:hypothetical protein